MPSLQVQREPAWLAGGAGAFFAWRHSAPQAPARGCVAVVCPPLGFEYTRSHRSLRHLADRLARAGVPALRFDYPGVGDSPGGDLDPDRLGAWQATIRAAIDQARAWSGCERVCLVGVRLGATLAALVAAQQPVDWLVLWNPVVRGRTYLRELQAIALTAARNSCDIDGALEAAGAILSAETLAALQAVNLLELRPRATRRVLLLGRDDLAADEALARHLAHLGVAHDSEAASGWNGMMADHQFTVVPDAALDRIVAWVLEQETGDRPRFPRERETGDRPRFPSGRPLPRSAEIGVCPQLAIPFHDENGAAVEVTETLCRFGEGGKLFGILSRADEDSARPVVVMFNAGSIHHVGPNRMYVLLARSLAALGFPCLRFDLEGIGDSVLEGPGRENHPYPQTAKADARAALDFLRRRFGYARFIPLGLCSGAHNAFHIGVEFDQDAIAELILINPLTLYWVEGMSIESTARAYDALAYKRSMRDPGRWMKLLRGDVNFRRLFEVALSYPKTAARASYDALRETLVPAKGPRLSRDLAKLMAMRRRVTFLVAEGDPGREVLLAGAPRTTSRAIRSGQLRFETIPGADHTFSQWKPRRELIGRVASHLRSRAGMDG